MEIERKYLVKTLPEHLGEVPRSNEIIHWEEQGKTVIEGDPASEISRCFFDLATLLWKEEENA
jgi:nitrogenase iron protein NifH